jgi:hypothetical protein
MKTQFSTMDSMVTHGSGERRDVQEQAIHHLFLRPRFVGGFGDEGQRKPIGFFFRA